MARRPCGESLLELTFQTLGRDVMFGRVLHRDLDLDPRGLEADDLHVVGHMLPVRMLIALAFFKRIFTRSLPMNQAHGPPLSRLWNLLRQHEHDVLGRRRAERTEPPSWLDRVTASL
jgi:hypothetical protein